MNQNSYLLYGSDFFSIKKETEYIFKKNEISLEDIEFYDAEEEGILNAITAALTLPFLSEKKGVVLKNASFLCEGKTSSITNDDLEELIRYCQLDNPSTIFVIQVVSEKLDSRKKIVKYLTKNISVKVFNPKRESDDIFEFIREELRKNNLSIDPLALTQFVNRVGNDKTMIANELDKLISYAYGKNTINTEMVFAITTRNIDDNIFQLVNAVIANNKESMLEIYKDLSSIKIDAIWMLGAISSKFQEILYTKELLKQKYKYEDVMKYFQATKGRTYYIMKNAKDVDDHKLMQYLEKLEDLDYKIKSGQIDKNLALELFLLGVE